MITKNAVYDYVYDAVIAEYPTAYIAGIFEPIPPSFPALFIREIGNVHNNENVTFSGVQGVRTSTFEVQIESNSLSGMMTEAYNILSVVADAFASIYYILENTTVLEEGDSGIFRLRAQFRRVIGLADTMPD